MQIPPQRNTTPWTGVKLRVNIKASDQDPPLLRTVAATGTKPSTAYRTENGKLPRRTSLSGLVQPIRALE